MRARANVLTVGAFGAAAGVSVETIRFYQRKGLLRVPERSYGTIRRYDAEDVERVKFVKSAQHLGFSLDEVKSLLALQDGTNCAEARLVAEQKLGEVRVKLRDLTRIESTLKQLVSACEAMGGAVSCPLISALLSGPPRETGGGAVSMGDADRSASIDAP